MVGPVYSHFKFPPRCCYQDEESCRKVGLLANRWHVSGCEGEELRNEDNRRNLRKRQGQKGKQRDLCGSKVPTLCFKLFTLDKVLFSKVGAKMMQSGNVGSTLRSTEAHRKRLNLFAKRVTVFSSWSHFLFNFI